MAQQDKAASEVCLIRPAPFQALGVEQWVAKVWPGLRVCTDPSAARSQGRPVVLYASQPAYFLRCLRSGETAGEAVAGWKQGAAEAVALWQAAPERTLLLCEDALALAAQDEVARLAARVGRPLPAVLPPAPVPALDAPTLMLARVFADWTMRTDPAQAALEAQIAQATGGLRAAVAPDELWSAMQALHRRESRQAETVEKGRTWAQSLRQALWEEAQQRAQAGRRAESLTQHAAAVEAQLSRKVAEQTAEIRQKLAEAEAYIDKVHASRSWRVTRPLRAFGRRMRGDV